MNLVEKIEKLKASGKSQFNKVELDKALEKFRSVMMRARKINAEKEEKGGTKE